MNPAAGWYPIAYTDELPEGGVEPIEHFGREMVLYRGEDGVTRVLDAHCRHLGAHLGYGGRVEGSSIRCPFHAWRWTANGSCDEIPYAQKIPPGATLRSWEVCERNGLVLLWYGPRPSGAEPDVPRLRPSTGRALVRTRRWADADSVSGVRSPVTLSDGRTVEIERLGYGPGFFVDRAPPLVVCGGWTPVDDRRGHLRTITFAPREAEWSDEALAELWQARYGARDGEACR